MRGRKAQPSKLRILKGETRPSRINQAEPQPDGELGDPPRELSKEAKAVWQAEAPYWATETDRGAFARYCRAVADAAMHRQACEDEGWTIRASTGTLQRHPASTLYKEACDRADRLAAEFGLTPSSRTRVQVPKQRPNPANDPLAPGWRERLQDGSPT